MNDIDWSNVTSGDGLAGFSTRIGRYLRVLNPILFDFIVSAVAAGPTSAFRRVMMVSKGETTVNCHLSDFPAVFPSPRASSGCPAVTHSGCPGYSGTDEYALTNLISVGIVCTVRNLCCCYGWATAPKYQRIYCEVKLFNTMRESVSFMTLYCAQGQRIKHKIDIKTSSLLTLTLSTKSLQLLKCLKARASCYYTEGSSPQAVGNS